MTQMMYEIPLKDVETNRESHMEKIALNITKYRDLALRNVDLRNLIAASHEAVATHRAKITHQIASARDPDTNKPIFGNPDAREGALLTTLADDAVYQGMMREQRQFEAEEAQNLVEMEVTLMFNRMWTKDLDILLASMQK